ncbi:hypothetical protein BCR37DRAFT_395532 [Protomyces lactucae-debilis]|uniref:Uncharacterized protein n=1 Tax=Protomyces lactucae-debilis TaxID=2754530 RepID=A0A1Y2EV29_PROLT|nr:uncharacterized protein BCR37DRAFT_395532 [Protomyces lactucae-debilis]ORY75432.1 hypothetical protein BCR37DRAFT_395532 [Protomyces lactucae-debilis]
MATLGTPAFLIRDLDRHPHLPDSPMQRDVVLKPTARVQPDMDPTLHELARLQHRPTLQQPPTPAPTPEQHRKAVSGLHAHVTHGMSRSGSDLSSYTSTSLGSMTGSPPAGTTTLFKSSSFTLPALFKWRKALSQTEETPVTTPTTEAAFHYFAAGESHLDDLQRGLATEQQTLAQSTEQQLQEERRRRHLAEDRLAAVEEEVTRLCTVMLPSDCGETGEAYFSSILESVRLAIDAYEERTLQLAEQVEEKTAALALEQRRRLDVELENTALREQLREATAALESDVLKQENAALRTQLAAQIPAEDLLQRVRDTEAQRDALRQVSRSLRQRLTHETRKYEEKLMQLHAGTRVHGRQLSSASLRSLPLPLTAFSASGRSTPSTPGLPDEDATGCLPLELETKSVLWHAQAQTRRNRQPWEFKQYK